MYQHLDDIAALGFRGSKTMAKKLVDNKDNAYLSYELATIKLDVELEEKPESLVKSTPDQDELVKLYGQMVFKSWLNELLEGSSDSEMPASAVQKSVAKAEVAAVEPTVAEIDRSQYETILDEESFTRWLEKLQSAEVFAFDTETDSLDYMVANLVGLSFAVEEGQAAYVPLTHDYLDAPEQLDRDWVLDKLKPILEDVAQHKVGRI